MSVLLNGQSGPLLFDVKRPGSEAGHYLHLRSRWGMNGDLRPLPYTTLLRVQWHLTICLFHLLCHSVIHALLLRFLISNLTHFYVLSQKLRKATISYVMSVCPPVCQHGTTRPPPHPPPWMDFKWNLMFWLLSENLSRKFFPLKSD